MFVYYKKKVYHYYKLNNKIKNKIKMLNNDTITAPMVQIPKEKLKFVLRILDKEQAGDVFLAICDYVINGVIDREMDDLSSSTFELIQSSIDSSEKSYVDCVRRAEAANAAKAEKKNKNNNK